MNSKTSGGREKIFALAVSISATLSACSGIENKETKSETPTTSTTTAASTSTTTSTATSTTTSTATTASTSTAPTTTTSTPTSPTATASKDATKSPVSPTEDRRVASGAIIPKVEAARKKIKLGSMPDSEVICTVGNKTITIGEYRRQLKSREEQVQADLSVSPDLKRQLMEDAKKNHIGLTADERKRLLETAKKAEDATGKVLLEQLKQNHQTIEQFNNNVLDLGVAFKDATYRIEQNLLHQLVDRALLTEAARTNNFGPSAFQAYQDEKKSKGYQDLLKTGFTADELREEMIDNALVERMIKKISGDVTATDADAQKYYDDHSSDFKHGDLIRVSQIVIAAPKADLGSVDSIRTQVKKSDPKLTGEKLEAMVKLEEQHQKQKADEVLAKALKGEDFTKLANEYTDDPMSKQTKGDMGFQDRKNLLPAFADKIAKLKPGQVYPSIIDSPYGYHVVKVTDEKPAGTLPFNEVKSKIISMLSPKKADEALQKWLIEKRRTSDVRLSADFQGLVAADKDAPAKTTN